MRRSNRKAVHLHSVPSRERWTAKEIMDNVLISEHCLQQYKEQIPYHVPWSKISEHMRRYIAKHGKPSDRGADYLQIRVPGRFTVRIRSSEDGGWEATQLYLPPWRGKQGRRAA